MPTPRNRSEFEHNIFMTLEMAYQKIENKHFDPYFVQKTIPELRKLKFTPNQRVNLSGVSEGLRLRSNMMHWMELMP